MPVTGCPVFIRPAAAPTGPCGLSAASFRGLSSPICTGITAWIQLGGANRRSVHQGLDDHPLKMIIEVLRLKQRAEFGGSNEHDAKIRL